MAPSTIISMYTGQPQLPHKPFKGYAPICMQTRDLLVYSAILAWLLQRPWKAAQSFEMHKSMASIYHFLAEGNPRRRNRGKIPPRDGVCVVLLQDPLQHPVASVR
jgi:hypothetical protein